jgi:hypothetical protein
MGRNILMEWVNPKECSNVLSSKPYRSRSEKISTNRYLMSG